MKDYLRSLKNIQTFDPVILTKEIFVGIWEDLFSRIWNAENH